MTVLFGWQVAAVAANAGIPVNQWVTSVAIAAAESGFNTDSELWTAEEDSVGLWQINLYAHPQYYKARLREAQYNADAMMQIYSAGGGSWNPWTTYTRGNYLEWIDLATDAVKKARSMGYFPGNPKGVGEFQPPTGGGGGAQFYVGWWDFSQYITDDSANAHRWGDNIAGGTKAIHQLIGF